MRENIGETLESVGVFQHGIIATGDIVFSGEVRKLCEDNACGKFGRTWACPPALGTLDECRAICLGFGNMLVFSGKYDLEDSFDFEGMTEGMNAFKRMARELEQALRPRLARHLMLANEGCGACGDCAYPDPCRLPGQAHGSLEGYGIFVNKLAESVGMNYINGANTVTYFGGLLFDEFID